MRKLSNHAVSCLVLSAVLTGCGADTESQPDSESAPGASEETDPVGRLEQAVQTATAGHYHFDFWNTRQQVSGVMFRPLTDDGQVWASCGLTFISKHFAITASHCVPARVIHNQRQFFVQNFNIDQFVARLFSSEGAALSAKFQQAATVTGTYPNWTTQARMAPSDGYVAMEPNAMTCGSVLRCGKTWGPQDNCPPDMAAQHNGEGVDIALVFCPDRPAGRPWTTVFQGDDTTGMPVEAHWTHEMLNLAVEETDGFGPPGNFWNYSFYSPNPLDPVADMNAKRNNWHYRGLFFNQFFPVVSRTFPDGTQYATTSLVNETIRFTDMFACHGTSGSGVFPQNSNQLLGPVSGGGNADPRARARLCSQTEIMGSGVNNSAFTRPVWARRLEALAWVQSDR